MNTKRIVLFSVLVVALLLAGGFGYQALGGGAALASPAKGPVGSWVVTVALPNQPEEKVVVMFTSDGTMVDIENGNAGLGVWEKISADSYAFTMFGRLDPDISPLLYSVKLVSTFQLSQDGEQYSGPFVATFYDREGTPLFSMPGTATGVRMHVEPMP